MIFLFYFDFRFGFRFRFIYEIIIVPSIVIINFKVFR